MLEEGSGGDPSERGTLWDVPKSDGGAMMLIPAHLHLVRPFGLSRRRRSLSDRKPCLFGRKGRFH